MESGRIDRGDRTIGNTHRRARQDSFSAGALAEWVARIGVLRLIVAAVVLACLPLVFLSGMGSSGWGIIPSQITPVLVVLLVWVLPFDMLMARVFMADAEPADRGRFKTVIKLDVLLLVALLAFWGPFFLALLQRS